MPPHESPSPLPHDRRARPDELQLDRARVGSTPLLQQTIDAISDSVLILNGCRQVVAANRAMLDMVAGRLEQLLGRRPGELIGCTHAQETPSGCGTAAGCAVCGAMDVVLESQRCNERVTRECRISLAEPVGSSLDLKVSATSVFVDGERYTICVLSDISDQKRLTVLARLFFHDVLNTAGGIRGYAELIREHLVGQLQQDEELAELQQLADHLVEEIQMQRDLTYAEAGELSTQFRPHLTHELLHRLIVMYQQHPVAHDRHLQLQESWQGCVVTDERLLQRVLGNMIKNALEAAQPGERVTVDCFEQDPDVVFTVHNPGVIPGDVQLQIFQRSFSTKNEPGRGVGTHSMKLFGERYLGGKVAFESRPERGTTFSITIPKISFGQPDC